MTATLPMIGALLSIYLLWGATYLGMRVAVESLPPFLMAGTRFLVAGTLVFLYARLRSRERPRLEHWMDAAKVGALMLVCGNGLVSWSEQTVPSGIAALMIATVPLWMILLGLLGRNARRPGPAVVFGILLGFAGIALLVLPGPGAHGRIDPLGLAALLAASFFWAAGSLLSRTARHPGSPLLSVGMQMIVGGALLLTLSGLTGEWARWDPARVTPRSLLGLGYLILFGSIVAYNAYIWLMRNAEPTWVSTYAFVNPVVAVLLGWVLAGERLSGSGVWGSAIIVLSVVIITMRRQSTKTPG